jgi:hypothetical protein
LLSVNESNFSDFQYFVQNKSVHLNGISDVEEVFVFSSNGSLVKSLKNYAQNELKFELEQTGFYLVMLKTVRGITSFKIIIQ